MTIGERLRECRNKKGYSMNQIMILTNGEINVASVSRYETGERIPHVKALELLSEIYGVSIDYLVKGYESQGLITKEQSDLLEEFDKLNQEDKEMALMFIKRMSK